MSERTNEEWANERKEKDRGEKGMYEWAEREMLIWPQSMSLSLRRFSISLAFSFFLFPIVITARDNWEKERKIERREEEEEEDEADDDPHQGGGKMLSICLFVGGELEKNPKRCQKSQSIYLM